MTTLPPIAALNLRRRFAATSLGVIVVIALGLGWLMSHMLTQRMLQREGEVSMDFIQNLLDTDKSAQYLASPNDAALRERFLGSMAHLASMSEPVRANAYRTDGTVVWSTDQALIGRRYPVNDELDDALQGRLVVHSGELGDPAGEHALDKGEHIGLAERTTFYVESYIPILDPASRKVLGVMELYKVPVQLNAAIHDALLQLWLACAASAVLLFAALYWIVARADRLMHQQQALLAERQTLASAVELAQAVAHNLRNPLASIRVSAEMLATSDGADAEQQEHCTDITASVDRADRWITELVRVSQAPALTLEDVPPTPIARACIEEMTPEMRRRNIECVLQDGQAPSVRAHPAMLRQILISILANATDVMPDGGRIAVDWTVQDSMLCLRITDTGPGLPDEVRHALFRPFFSTKSGGLGIGLALVRRMLEQWSGHIALTAASPRGTRVELTLPLAAATRSA